MRSIYDQCVNYIDPTGHFAKLSEWIDKGIDTFKALKAVKKMEQAYEKSKENHYKNVVTSYMAQSSDIPLYPVVISADKTEEDYRDELESTWALIEPTKHNDYEQIMDDVENGLGVVPSVYSGERSDFMEFARDVTIEMLALTNGTWIENATLEAMLYLTVMIPDTIVVGGEIYGEEETD